MPKKIVVVILKLEGPITWVDNALADIEGKSEEFMIITSIETT